MSMMTHALLAIGLLITGPAAAMEVDTWLNVVGCRSDDGCRLELDSPVPFCEDLSTIIKLYSTTIDADVGGLGGKLTNSNCVLISRSNDIVILQAAPNDEVSAFVQLRVGSMTGWAQVMDTELVPSR